MKQERNRSQPLASGRERLWEFLLQFILIILIVIIIENRDNELPSWREMGPVRSRTALEYRLTVSLTPALAGSRVRLRVRLRLRTRVTVHGLVEAPPQALTLAAKGLSASFQLGVMSTSDRTLGFRGVAGKSLPLRHRSLEELVHQWRVVRQREEVNAAIQRGIADVDAGRTRPLDEFWDEFSKKHNIPPDA